MPRFFVPQKNIDLEMNSAFICGEDSRHISRSLRMAVGDEIIISDGEGAEYEGVIDRFDGERVYLLIKDCRKITTEPPFKARIFQALPKGDRLDTVIQKSTECGAFSIETFESEFCIAKEKAESAERKLERRRKIALEAAKQCGRGIVPEIRPTCSFEEAVLLAAKADIPIFCYEGEGTLPLGELVCDKRKSLSADRAECPEISVVIGSEGGFSSREAEFAKENGMLLAGLGKRILRTETVAGFVLACLVYEFEL